MITDSSKARASMRRAPWRLILWDQHCSAKCILRRHARAGAELAQHSQAALVAVPCCDVRWCVCVPIHYPRARPRTPTHYHSAERSHARRTRRVIGQVKAAAAPLRCSQCTAGKQQRIFASSPTPYGPTPPAGAHACDRRCEHTRSTQVGARPDRRMLAARPLLRPPPLRLTEAKSADAAPPLLLPLLLHSLIDCGGPQRKGLRP